MDDSTAQRIADAAVDCFFEDGFEGTAIRAISARADVPIGRIYEHHASKLALLREIVNAGIDGLIAQTMSALAEASDAPDARLDAVIWAHTDFHARHGRASWVAQAELRSLPPEDRAPVLAKRRQLVGLVEGILEDGVALGCFAVSDTAAVSRALVGMCGAVAPLGDAENVVSARRLARTYCELAARMTGARSSDAGHGLGVLEDVTMRSVA